MSPEQLEDRVLEFAVDVCRALPSLEAGLVGDHIGHQLLRSSTSSAANYAEARGAESRRDFAHKIQVCLKELRESRLWLRCIERLDLAPAELVASLLAEAEELVSIFVASVNTLKRRQHLQPRSNRR